MSKRTGVEHLKVVSMDAPLEHAIGANNGTAVDCRGFDDLMVIIHLGVLTATGDATIKFQESSDNGVADAWADITGAAFSEKDLADGAGVWVGNINLAKRERYIRSVNTVADDTTLLGIVGILGGAKERVVSQVVTPEFSV